MFDLFKRKKPKTLLDELNATTASLYRPLLNNRKDASDDDIMEIVQTVMRAYKAAADSKSETIPASTLLDICSHFVGVYDLKEHDFFMEHLKYEINVYLESGLRDRWGGSSSDQNANADACVDKANELYDSGESNEAVNWYKKAANNGHVGAQAMLGSMFARGDGVNQDFKEAEKWLHLAADNNHSEAQHILGVMYIRGDGVEQNIPKAIEILKKAAEQGHEEALNVLSRLADTISKQK